MRRLSSSAVDNRLLITRLDGVGTLIYDSCLWSRTYLPWPIMMMTLFTILITINYINQKRWWCEPSKRKEIPYLSVIHNPELVIKYELNWRSETQPYFGGCKSRSPWSQILCLSILAHWHRLLLLKAHYQIREIYLSSRKADLEYIAARRQFAMRWTIKRGSPFIPNLNMVKARLAMLWVKASSIIVAKK